MPYAESIQTVFLVAVPIAALAFLATWLIPQVELKQWPEAGTGVPDAGQDAGQDAGMAVAGATSVPEALPGGEDSRQATPPSPLAHEALDPQDTSRADP